MTRSRKQTAYRKSRTFGDIHGGRVRRRVPDNIFKRCHSLARPDPNDDLPILIVDNPSRNFYFPISGEEALETLHVLPPQDVEGITHLWLRRASDDDFEQGKRPFAEFICGSGVRVIILYAWPKTRLLCLGKKLPKGRFKRDYEDCGAEFYREGGLWFARFPEEGLKRFYLEYLLLHEIGHHVDWYFRRWGKANGKQIEDAADDYAVQWSDVSKLVFDRVAKRSNT